MHRTRRTPSIALRLVPALIPLLLGCQSDPAAPVLGSPSTEAIQKSVTYLSSDEMEGRGMGTRGLDSAAEYTAGYFHALGLQPPPGQQDFFQPFTHTTITGLDPSTTLTVNARHAERREEFQPHSLSAEGKFDASVVFVGYGITKSKDDESEAYDDYANVDVKGKIVLALRYEPHTAEGRSRLAIRNVSTSDHAALPRKAKNAAQRGAIAMLVVHPPAHRGEESFTPALRQGGGETMSIPVVQIKQSVADEFLKAGGAKDLKSLQGVIDKNFAPQSVALNDSKVSGNVTFARTVYNLRNVTAYLPGQGKNAKEFIVVGAHYDHLGRGGVGSLTPRSSDVHNGADDNASGTAAVLELARLFTESPEKPGRSILFTLFSGEESGLLGSKYWVEHPPVPLNKVVTMVNLDMVGRLKDQNLVVGGSATASSFATLLDKADFASPVNIKSSNEWKNGMSPSDNTSFVLKRIPILFFFTGQHADYHRPTDDADKINYPGLVAIVDLVAKIVVELGEHNRITFTPPPPSTQPARSSTQPSPHGEGASLGVVPDYTADDTTKGVRISGTVPGSAAEQAGLLPNDLIVEFDGKSLDNLYDLTDALSAGSPGQSVNINAIRNGNPISVKATLTARRRTQ